jgi:hypothetical protein
MPDPQPSDPECAEALGEDLRALETSLRALAPAPASLDRDRLMYRAGQASAPRRGFWPLLATLSTLAACVLGVLLLQRPEPPTVKQIVYVPVETPAPETPAPTELVDVPAESSPSWLAPSRSRRLEEQILRWELDGLPAAAPITTGRPSGESYPMLLRSF